MKIIDRYLLGQFLRTFAICYISMLGLYVVFDFFSNMEEFCSYANGGMGLARVVVRFYSYRCILFFDQISALLTLASAMFTISWIQRSNELTALMAAGISKLRVVTPIICAAIAITVVAAACRELVIPKFSEQLSINAQHLDENSGKTLAGPVRDFKTDIQIYGEMTFRKDKRISNPDFLLPRSLQRYGKHLCARDAYFEQRSDEQRRGYLLGYRLVGVSDPSDLLLSPSLVQDREPIVITPLDADWLNEDECFVVSNITFEQLTASRQHQYSSTMTLIRDLRNPSLDYGADVRTTIHSRFVKPLLDITLLFLGLPLVLRRANRNVFMAIGSCGLLVIAFILVQMVCSQFGFYWARPVLGAWMPLILFVPLAAGLFESMNT